jgi:GTP-binding protein
VQKRPVNVVLAGRPNVGKSTLFNRITETRRAIVTAVPGTTRDVIALPVSWRGATFQLTDTGGVFGASEDPLHDLVVARGRRAVESADLIVFVVDGREGKVPADQEIAQVLRTAGVPVILAINKMDDRRARDAALDFYQMGFDPVVEIAAEHGQGVAELLDEIIKRIPMGGPGASGSPAALPGQEEGDGTAAAETHVEQTGVAIVGRPNVGKSSLVNRLLREEARAGQVEAVSVLLARRAIEQSDVAVIVADASEGLLDQDAAIAGEAEKAGRGIVIAVNKWDLVKGKGPDFARTFDEELRHRLKFLDYAPLVHISAATGERTARLLEVIDQVAAARKKRVPTGELNRFIEAVTAVHPPASPGRKAVRILYAAQVGIAPPSFVFFTNVATTFHFSYERYLVNRLRESFGFAGSPIRIQVRARERRKR